MKASDRKRVEKAAWKAGWRAVSIGRAGRVLTWQIDDAYLCGPDDTHYPLAARILSVRVKP